MFISAAHDEETIQVSLDAFDHAVGFLVHSITEGSVRNHLDGQVITPVIRPAGASI